ncbi:GNAT family N-acetyltransferase [Psychromicrobium xiongbiense]|uniref:GNAT family N-acetyltransferase n=1 Tax=Psychromicrobium xiongbiense TaxID=3051184 RepID=UPI0025541323|nr:GNAT family N-acetyltransferase [Psychromicrobium sp. YIM S02556]
MVKALPREALWSAFHSPRSRTPRGSGREVRGLGQADTAALVRLVDRNPVANVFFAAHLERQGSALSDLPGVETWGYFDADGDLLAACWVGGNVIPLEADEEAARAFARRLLERGRGYSSIYGEARSVLPLYQALGSHGFRAREVRACQPLLALSGPPRIEPSPWVTPSRLSNFDRILPAAVAMFEEEVGYSPLVGGEAFYRRRVEELIRREHSLSHCDDRGEVIFKADIGVLSRAVSQIQGVWIRPADRGKGLSAGYMAAVVVLAQRLAPVVSLYVNDYNVRARATYETVGFEQVGTFATVLF